MNSTTEVADLSSSAYKGLHDLCCKDQLLRLLQTGLHTGSRSPGDHVAQHGQALPNRSSVCCERYVDAHGEMSARAYPRAPFSRGMVLAQVVMVLGPGPSCPNPSSRCTWRSPSLPRVGQGSPDSPQACGEDAGSNYDSNCLAEGVGTGRCTDYDKVHDVRCSVLTQCFRS